MFMNIIITRISQCFYCFTRILYVSFITISIIYHVFTKCVFTGVVMSIQTCLRLIKSNILLIIELISCKEIGN